MALGQIMGAKSYPQNGEYYKNSCRGAIGAAKSDYLTRFFADYGKSGGGAKSYSPQPAIGGESHLPQRPPKISHCPHPPP